VKKTIYTDFRVVVTPRRIGDLGWMSVSDRMASNNIERDMRERCEQIAEQVNRHVDHVADVRVEVDTEDVCSFCGLGWEELTKKEYEANPDSFEDWERPGIPVCCAKAQEQWSETHISLCSYQTDGSYTSPPEHCDQYAGYQSDYCAMHEDRVNRLEALVESTPED
jgi:hypothetical protein